MAFEPRGYINVEGTSMCCPYWPRGALSTSTHGEVSPIFLGQDIARSDIFGSK